MTKRKKITIRALSLLMILCLCATFLFKGDVPVKASDTKTNSLISKVNGDIYNDLSSYFDDANVSRLPETVSADQDISVIVEMSTQNGTESPQSLSTCVSTEARLTVCSVQSSQ